MYNTATKLADAWNERLDAIERDPELVARDLMFTRTNLMPVPDKLIDAATEAAFNDEMERMCETDK